VFKSAYIPGILFNTAVRITPSLLSRSSLELPTQTKPHFEVIPELGRFYDYLSQRGRVFYLLSKNWKKQIAV
jgi:hypothetical protein